MALKNTLVALIIFAFSNLAIAKDFEVSHKVGKDETAWFLAQVFYGKGAEYTKILAANKMTSPEELKTGKEIRIVNPLHHPEQVSFGDRYTSLWEKREKTLADKKSAVSVVGKEVVVPSTKVREASSISDLPLTEVKEPNKSPIDKAKQELQKLFEKDTFKRNAHDRSEPF